MITLKHPKGQVESRGHRGECARGRGVYLSQFKFSAGRLPSKFETLEIPNFVLLRESVFPYQVPERERGRGREGERESWGLVCA